MMLLGVLASAIKKAILGGGSAAVKALYWRVRINSNNGDATYTEVSKLYMAEQVNGPTLCVGGIAISSTDFDTANYYAARAFDGNRGTQWVTVANDPNPWIGYQFAAPVTVREISILPNRDNIPARSPKNFGVESSDDGLYWVRRATLQNQINWADGETRTFAVDPISTGNNRWNNIVSRWAPSGAQDSTILSDPKGKVWALTGATLDYTTPVAGSPELVFSTTSSSAISSGSADFSMGTGDFYVRGWVRFTGVNGGGNGSYIFDIGTNGIVVSRKDTRLLSFYTQETGTGSSLYAGGPLVADNILVYLEVSRYNGVVTAFCNGVAWGSAAMTGTYSTTSMNYGSYGGGAGYSSGMRLAGWEVCKGVAGHVTNYTPPSSTATLLPGDFYGYDSLSPAVISQMNFAGASGSTVFKDDIGRQWTPNGAVAIATDKGWNAGSFAGGYLTTPLTQDFNFGSDPFVLEAWVVPTLANDGGLFSKRSSGANGYAWEIRQTGALWLRSKIGSTWLDNHITTAAGSIKANVLQHVSLAFDGARYTMAINGVVQGWLTTSDVLDTSEVVAILGASSSAGGEDPFPGEIRAWRATRGNSRGQTRDFSPDVAPFPQTPGTPRLYWRVRVKDYGSGLTVAIMQAEMAAYPGGPTQCTGGAATDSTHQSGFEAAQAFNGNKTDGEHYWAAASGTRANDPSPWLCYQFAQPTTVNELRLWNTNYPNSMVKDVVVQSSDDGVVWLPEWEVAGQIQWTNLEQRIFSRPRPQRPTVWWRLAIFATNNGSQLGGDYYGEVQELQFRGSIAGASLCTGGSSFASTDYFGENGARAFDGNTTDQSQSWASGAGVPPIWYLGYKLPIPAIVNEIAMWSFANGGYPNRTPANFLLQSSMDSTTGLDGTWNTEMLVPFQAPWGASELRNFARSATPYALPPIVQSIAAAYPTTGAFNPADAGADIVLAGGGYDASSSGGGWESVRGRVFLSAGKAYFEIATLNLTDNSLVCGLMTAAASLNNFVGSDAHGWGLNFNYSGGLRPVNAGSFSSISGTYCRGGDRMMCAVDFDAGKMWFGSIGLFAGNPIAGTGETFDFPPNTAMAIAGGVNYGNGGACRIIADPTLFQYAPPVGFNKVFL